MALAKPTPASVALNRVGAPPATGATGTSQAGTAKTSMAAAGSSNNDPTATNTVPASSLAAPSSDDSVPSTTSVASAPTQRPSVTAGFNVLPADVAQTVLAQRLGGRSGSITQGFDTPPAAPASAPGGYGSGGNFNTAQAADDYAKGKISAGQLSQVYDAADAAGNRQGAGISPATQAEMRGTASVGQQLQASQDAQAAADAASRRQPGGSPYGIVSVDPTQQGNTYVGDGKMSFNG